MIKKKLVVCLVLFMSAVVALGVTNHAREEEYIVRTETVEEGSLLDVTIRACDIDGDPVSITIDDLPIGALLFNPQAFVTPPDPSSCDDDPNCLTCFENPITTSWHTIELNWTPNYLESGEHRLHMHAEDDKGGDDWAVFIINVTNKNRKPIL